MGVGVLVGVEVGPMGVGVLVGVEVGPMGVGVRVGVGVAVGVGVGVGAGFEPFTLTLSSVEVHRTALLWLVTGRPT
jgi:hypothetical protein